MTTDPNDAQTPDNKGKVYAALARAQAAFVPAAKDKEANITAREGRASYKYAYADLAECMHATRPALSANGLCVSHKTTTRFENGQTVYRVTAILGHGESGQRLTSTLAFAAGRLSPQEIGSFLTYYRRYTYMAVVGVAPEDDDDGAAAEAATRRNASRREASRTDPPPSDRKPAGRQPTRPSANSKTAGKAPTTTPPSSSQGSGAHEKLDFDGLKQRIPVASDPAELLRWRNALPQRGNFDSEQQEELARLIDEQRCRLKIQHIGTLDNAAQFKACLAALPSEGFTPEHKAMLEELLTHKIEVAESWENANAQAGQTEEG